MDTGQWTGLCTIPVGVFVLTKKSYVSMTILGPQAFEKKCHGNIAGLVYSAPPQCLKPITGHPVSTYAAYLISRMGSFLGKIPETCD